MSDKFLPLRLWIYVGLRVTDSGRSDYTYGLKEFGKTEIEVLHSTRSLEDIRLFLFNIAHYILAYNAEFKDDHTCGFSAEENFSIRISQGHFVEGDTFKILY